MGAAYNPFPQGMAGPPGETPPPDPVSTLLQTLQQPGPQGTEPAPAPNPVQDFLNTAMAEHKKVRDQIDSIVQQMQQNPPQAQVQAAAKSYQDNLEKHRADVIDAQLKKYGTAGTFLINLLRAPGQPTLQGAAKASADQDYQNAMKEAQTQIAAQQKQQQDQLQGLKIEAQQKDPNMTAMQGLIAKQALAEGNVEKFIAFGGTGNPQLDAITIAQMRSTQGQKVTAPAGFGQTTIVTRPVQGFDILKQSPGAKDIQGNPVDPTKFYNEHLDKMTGQTKGYDITSALPSQIQREVDRTSTDYKLVGTTPEGQNVYAPFNTTSKTITGPLVNKLPAGANLVGNTPQSAAPVPGPVPVANGATPATPPAPNGLTLPPGSRLGALNSKMVLNPDQQVALRNGRTGLDGTISSLNELLDNWDTMQSAGSRAKIAASNHDFGTGITGFIGKLGAGMVPLTDSETKLASTWKTLNESINTVRTALKATGFRGPEAFQKLLDQAGSPLGNPNVSKQVIQNTIKLLTKFRDNDEWALGTQGKAPPTNTKDLKSILFPAQ